MTPLARFRHYGLPVIAVLVFSVSLLVGIGKLLHERRESRADIKELVYGSAAQNLYWSAAQAVVEYWRFLDAFDRYALGPESARPDEVLTRLDILWSRVNIYHGGDVGARLAAIENAPAAIAGLSATLRGIEPEIQALTPGDREAYTAIRTRLVRHALPLFQMAQRTNLHDQDRALDFRLNTARTYWVLVMFLLGILAGGALLIVLLIREIRKATRLLAAANAAERRAQDTAERLSAVLNSAVTGIITIDANGIIQSFNPAAEELFGYRAEKVLSRNVSMLMPEPYRLEHDTYIANNLGGGEAKVIGQVRELSACHKEGRSFPIELSLGRMLVHDELYFVGFITDITERKEAEAEANRKTDLLHAIFDNMVQGIIVVDADLRITAFNARFLELLDLPADLVVNGAPYERIIRFNAERGEYGARDPEEVVREQVARAKRFEPRVFEIARPNRDVIEVRGRHLPHGGAITTYVDITERKRIEEEFRQAQKMEAIGRLTGGVAHEFNNLLCAIGGFAHLLTRRADDPEAVREWAEDIIGASDQAAALTSQLLAFSRKQILEPKVVGIANVLDDTNALIRPMLAGAIAKRLDIIVDLAEEATCVKVDPGQLSQVLVNLAINARDAMPDGGTLTIASRVTELDERSVAGFDKARPGRYVAISVTDTGTGIDEQTMEHIFEPFFTTKEVGEGTGLGLSMVYGMVQQSGGVITVESEVGHGTTFTIHLPMVDEAPDEVTDKASDGAELEGEAVPAGTETILIAEDELTVRQLARVALEALGYTVLTAADGNKALDVFRNHGDRIDLLVTDLIMPGLDGWRLARELTAERPDLKVLFITGHDIDAQQQATADAVLLKKPFDPDELGRIVRDILDLSLSASAA